MSINKNYNKLMYWKIIGSLFNKTVKQENCKRKNNLEDKKIILPSSLVFVYEQEVGF